MAVGGKGGEMGGRREGRTERGTGGERERRREARAERVECRERGGRRDRWAERVEGGERGGRREGRAERGDGGEMGGRGDGRAGRAPRNQGCFGGFANSRTLKTSLLWKMISRDIFTQIMLLNAPWVANRSYL